MISWLRQKLHPRNEGMRSGADQLHDFKPLFRNQWSVAGEFDCSADSFAIRLRWERRFR